MNYEKIIGSLAGLVVLVLIVWNGASNVDKVVPVVHIPTPVVTPQIISLNDFLGQAPLLLETETVDWKIYTGKEFTIKYPKDFTVNTKYVNNTLGPNKERKGVSFTIPAALAKGTNLSKDTLVSVEENLTSEKCEAKDFIDQQSGTGDPQTVVKIGGTSYTIAKSGGAGAGNYYDETVLAVPGTPCRGIRLFVHSTNIANYDPGTIKEFDALNLNSIFETMIVSYQAK